MCCRWDFFSDVFRHFSLTISVDTWSWNYEGVINWCWLERALSQSYQRCLAIRQSRSWVDNEWWHQFENRLKVWGSVFDFELPNQIGRSKILIRNWAIKISFESDSRLICGIYCLPVVKPAWIISLEPFGERMVVFVTGSSKPQIWRRRLLIPYLNLHRFITLHPINMVNIFIRFIFEPFETQTPWDWATMITYNSVRNLYAEKSKKK